MTDQEARQHVAQVIADNPGKTLAQLRDIIHRDDSGLDSLMQIGALLSELLPTS